MDNGEDIYDVSDLESGTYLIATIPFPYESYTDTPFFIMDESTNLFIPEFYYRRINERQIVFTNTNNINISSSSNIKFIFLHNSNTSSVNKKEYRISTKDNVGEVTTMLSEIDKTKTLYVCTYKIPNHVYFTNIDINYRYQIYLDRKKLTPETDYSISSKNGLLSLYQDLHEVDERYIDILVFYTGTNSNKAIQNLPQSGYIYLNRHEIDRNYNNNLMAVFVNGQLVQRDHITNISNNIYKINSDIQSRYDLNVLNMSPKIKPFVPFYKKSTALLTNEPSQKYIYDIFFHTDIVSIGTNIESSTDSESGHFTSIYVPIVFDPLLVDQPDLYLSLIHKKSPNIDYTLIFDNETPEYEVENMVTDTITGESHLEISTYKPDNNYINVTVELGELKDKSEPDYESNDPILFCKIPITLSSINEDYCYASTMIQNIIDMDTYNRSRFSDETKSITGETVPSRIFKNLICRMYINYPTPGDSNPVLYYDLTSTGYEEGNYISIFRWVVSTQVSGTGNIIWSKDIQLPVTKLLDQDL